MKQLTGKIVCKWIVKYLGSTVLCVIWVVLCLRYLESPNVIY